MNVQLYNCYQLSKNDPNPTFQILLCRLPYLIKHIRRTIAILSLFDFAIILLMIIKHNPGDDILGKTTMSLEEEIR